MGTRLNISTAYHPQTDGQSERIFQNLEDMLRACIIEFGGSWDSHLPLAEFSYKNSYHVTIGMPPYEMLYGINCRTPVCWSEIRQKDFASLHVVKETSEKFEQIKARMKAAKDRQKSYADKRRRDLELQVPLDDIKVDNKLNYVEEPMAIVDRKDKRLRNKVIPLVKVQWKHRRGSEATWETES
ncbi:hypothetical protein L1987_27543 [Smallanthus sonchifolius]|uniref:Uncharacterized protein n=1 Tax=Smallanthus sonchifolius TaxID=185202 RepID=A0ACB9ICB9_9ASTR|nr:hypothetical protein L1987_27543 [Smallanthus sonchifolius]